MSTQLTAFEDIPFRERIIVALDCSETRALELADELAGKAHWLKVGMTLFYRSGPAIVAELKARGFQVFLDLKLHDIPHQVQGAAASALASGADMLTMHATGGIAMMRAGLQGVTHCAKELGCACPICLGITVLTSMDEQSLAHTGVTRPLATQVISLARDAQTAGLHGVVASPQEASSLRETLGQKAYIVTPGVRPIGSETGDQSRVASPPQAFLSGASHIVVGRPITQAESPARAFEKIVASCENTIPPCQI